MFPLLYISNRAGLIPLLTFHSVLPIENSISVTRSFSLTVFINWPLLIFLKGFPNKEKVMASINVDFPAPFLPTINVIGSLSRFTSKNVLPVAKKFFHLTVFNFIIINPLWSFTFSPCQKTRLFINIIITICFNCIFVSILFGHCLCKWSQTNNR